MNRNIKTTRITEAALLTGIMVIFSLIGTFIFPFIDFIYPIPAIILAKRHDYKVSIMALISAAIIITMLLGVQAGLYYVCLYSPLAAIMSLLISKDKRPSTTILAGTLTYILSFILMILIMQAIVGVDFKDQMEEIFKQSFGIQENIMSKFESLEGATEQFKETYSQLIDLVIRIIPAMIIITSAAMAALNYLVAYKLSKRLKIKIQPIEDFSKFKLPDNFSIGVIVIVVAMIFLKKTNFANYDNLYINLVYIISILFLIQGLALVRYLFTKYKINKGFRLLIVLMLFLTPILTNLVMLMGAAEMIFDFRKLKKKRIR